MALHCPECGFVNDESANYCQKCGAYLHPGEEAEDSTTMTYAIDETGELKPVDLDEVTAQGAALVIRAGGGRVGESFALSGDRLSIWCLASSYCSVVVDGAERAELELDALHPALLVELSPGCASATRCTGGRRRAPSRASSSSAPRT